MVQVFRMHRITPSAAYHLVLIEPRIQAELLIDVSRLSSGVLRPNEKRHRVRQKTVASLTFSQRHFRLFTQPDRFRFRQRPANRRRQTIQTVLEHIVRSAALERLNRHFFTKSARNEDERSARAELGGNSKRMRAAEAR